MQAFFTPKRNRYKKNFRRYLRSKNQTNVTLTKGKIGLQVLKDSRISIEQLEAFRRLVRRRVKRKGKLLFIRKANLSLTSKSAGVRMGSGKGNPTTWCLQINKGSVLVELKGVSFFKAFIALKKAMPKLSIPTRVIQFRN